MRLRLVRTFPAVASTILCGVLICSSALSQDAASEPDPSAAGSEPPPTAAAPTPPPSRDALDWKYGASNYACKKIRSGDTLESISEKIYGTAKGAGLLAQANRMTGRQRREQLDPDDILIVPNPKFAATARRWSASELEAAIAKCQTRMNPSGGPLVKAWRFAPSVMLGMTRSAANQYINNIQTGSNGLEQLPRLGLKLEVWRGYTHDPTAWVFGGEAYWGRYESMYGIYPPSAWSLGGFAGKRGIWRPFNGDLWLSALFRIGYERFSQIATQPNPGATGATTLGALNTALWWVGGSLPLTWRWLELEAFGGYGYSVQSSFSDLKTTPPYALNGAMGGTTLRVFPTEHFFVDFTWRYFSLNGAAAPGVTLQLSGLDGAADVGWRF